jgi:hypothetical protein
VNWISSALSIVASVAGWWREQTNRKNAPDVRAAKVAQTKTDEQNRAETAVAKEDADETRKLIS